MAGGRGVVVAEECRRGGVVGVSSYRRHERVGERAAQARISGETAAYGDAISWSRGEEKGNVTERDAVR
jgi:hypothetical protein